MGERRYKKNFKFFLNSNYYMNIVNLVDAINFDVNQVGNKAYHLSTLQKLLSIKIPNGFVMTPEYIFALNELSLNKRKKTLHPLFSIINMPVIMRSSANFEDSSHSFAGIMNSNICDSIEEIAIIVPEFINLLNKPELIGYMKYFGYERNKLRIACLVQEYINSDYSGVGFTKHPITKNNNTIYIEFSKSHRVKRVVSGNIIPYSITINKSNNSIEGEYKPLKIETINKLTKILKDIELVFGYPQDVEWLIIEDEIWITQTRRITA